MNIMERFNSCNQSNPHQLHKDTTSDNGNNNNNNNALDLQSNDQMSTSLESRLITPSVCLTRNDSKKLNHRLKMQRIQESLVKVNTDRSSSSSSRLNLSDEQQQGAAEVED